MGYQTEKLKNGNLLVKDVPLMGPQVLTEKHFKVKDIDREWMLKGIETFAKNKGIGKLPYLWDRHNSKDKAAQVIGRLDNLRIGELDGEPWYFADVIITDSEFQQKFLSGKTPSKSVEFQPDNYYLRGLALLDGHEGHFDAGIPDFVPEGLYDELVALGLNAECTVLCHSSATTAMGATMSLTKEDLAAIAETMKPVVEGIVDAKLAASKGTVNNNGDVMADLQKVRDEERAAAEVKLAKEKRQNKIDAYAEAMAAKTKTPVALCRKALEKGETLTHIDDIYRFAMKGAEADVKLGIEREHGDSPDLKAEFEEFKNAYREAHGVELRQSFADYKRLAASITGKGLQERTDRHASRGVISVKDNMEAFA